MKILIVGAGAIGQVYGYFLQKGGADVTFYVRPKYVEEIKRGLVLYPLNVRKDLDRPERMTGFGVISSDEEAKQSRWDYVILCTHGGALHSPWFESFAPAVAGSHFVNLHQDPEGREAVARFFPEERIIDGMITLVSNAAPLPGETAAEPGISFWFPPLSKVPFQGAAAAVEPLLAVFRRGGFPCKHDLAKGVTPGGLIADTVLSTFVLALEGVDWKIDEFVKRPQSALTRAAILETLEVRCRKSGLDPATLRVPRLILGRTFFRLFIGLSQWLMPFDLETSLRVHFTKIREQGRAGLARNLSDASALGIAAPALQALALQVQADSHPAQRKPRLDSKPLDLAAPSP